jgi:1-acyl-sn-glycerol-3-phosphate acyltransferase
MTLVPSPTSSPESDSSIVQLQKPPKKQKPPKTQLSLGSKFLQIIGQALVWIVGKSVLHTWFQLRAEGVENLPQNTAVMLVANHSSHLDGPAVIASVNRYMGQVYSLAAKDYFFNTPTKAKICQHVLDMIAFQRRGSSVDCIKACQEVIADNKMILIFPEGTRSTTGELQPFKMGTGFLAMQLNIPIVPVYIQGSFEAFPKGARRPTRHPIRVKFGKPIPIASYQNRTDKGSRQLCQEIIQDIRTAIEQLAAS